MTTLEEKQISVCSINKSNLWVSFFCGEKTIWQKKHHMENICQKQKLNSSLGLKLYYFCRSAVTFPRPTLANHRQVNFTNILWAAFMGADHKSAIKLLNLTVFFALLGYACVKAAHRMLVTLTPRCLVLIFFGRTLYFQMGQVQTKHILL